MLRNWLIILLLCFTNAGFCSTKIIEKSSGWFGNPLFKLNRYVKNEKKNSATGRQQSKLMDDVAFTILNKPVIVDVLANDKLPINSSFKIRHLSNISHGKADLMTNSSKVKVTPAFNSMVPITFTYTVSDGRKFKASAKVLVHIRDSHSVSMSAEPNLSIDPVRTKVDIFIDE
tara:strand:+ start:159 stop:677 length:519 start_codon:yes stop_codon:yes gene_type:complete